MTGVLKQYQGDSLYLAAFAASLALLYWQDRKLRKNTGKKAILALVLAVVFIFNEFAYQIVGRITNATTYYRFFWMLPVLFVIAYQFTESFVSGKKAGKILAAALFALCLGFGANLFFLDRAKLNRPLNIYGLDPNVITIADAVMADWNSRQDPNESQSAEEEQPSVALDMYLEYQVRAYEPRILWGISRKAYLYQAQHGYDHKKYVRQQHMIAAVNEGLKKDKQALRRSLDKNGVDYLVIRTEFDMDGYLSEISVMPVMQSENYTLYRVE